MHSFIHLEVTKLTSAPLCSQLRTKIKKDIPKGDWKNSRANIFRAWLVQIQVKCQGNDKFKKVDDRTKKKTQS